MLLEFFNAVESLDCEVNYFPEFFVNFPHVESSLVRVSQPTLRFLDSEHYAFRYRVNLAIEIHGGPL
jgi:hypothetical protein